mgnify:FL=1
MRAIRADFADGNHLVTDINGTDEEIRAYYVGTAFNFGDTQEHPADRMVEAVAVTFLDRFVHLCADTPEDRSLQSACGVNLSELALSYPVGATVGAVSRASVTCPNCLAA